MSDAVVMYDDTVGELIDEITSKLSCIRGQQGAERETFVSSVQELIRECKKKIHSLKVEIRGLPGSERQMYDKKVKSHQSRLEQCQQQLREKEDQGQTPLGAEDDYGGGGGGGGGGGNGAPQDDGKQEVRNAFGRIAGYQNKSKAALADAEEVLQETEVTGQKAAQDLARQGEQLQAIDEELDRLGTDIQRAKRELNAFARRMATDKLILCCLFLLVVGIVIAIILKFVLKKDDDNNDAPVSS